MIYSMYFAGLYDRTFQGYPWMVSHMKGLGVVSAEPFFANLIKESKDDTFIFIITQQHTAQVVQFDAWVKRYELEEYVVFTPSTLIVNGNHPEKGPNLKLIVMASKEHAWREMFTEDGGTVCTSN